MNNFTLKIQTGFTLIELMIVVAIIGILSGVALPAYETYTKQSTFTEVIFATLPYKLAYEIGVQTAKITIITDADAGTNGIPAATPASGYINSITMTNGIITGQATAAIDNLTVTYTPNGITAPIQWSLGGTCVAATICN